MQVSERQILRVNKSNKTMGVTKIFDLLADHLQVKEEAQPRYKNSDTGIKIRTAEQNREDKRGRAKRRTLVKPLVQFKPVPATSQPNPRPNADHYANFPGNGTPHSSSNFQWPQNPNFGWNPVLKCSHPIRAALGYLCWKN